MIPALQWSEWESLNDLKCKNRRPSKGQNLRRLGVYVNIHKFRCLSKSQSHREETHKQNLFAALFKLLRFWSFFSACIKMEIKLLTTSEVTTFLGAW